MTALLDTHGLIWSFYSKAKLSRRVTQILHDESNEIVVSVGSAWEISMKVRLGKLPDAVELETNFTFWLQRAGYRLLPILVEDALRAGRLPGAHGDPFDRMIAAQALALDIPVISIDEKLEQFGVRRIW